MAKIFFNILLVGILAQTGSASGKNAPYYKSCNNSNNSFLPHESCNPLENRLPPLDDIKDITSTAQFQNFKEKLQKRILGNIKSKIFQTEMLKACAGNDRNWFTSKKLQPSKIKPMCDKQLKTVRNNIKKYYSSMRIELALSAPRTREDRILTSRATWFDASPSHSIPYFSKLPKLNSQEKQRAEDIYLETLSQVPLKHFSPDQFKKNLREGTLKQRNEKHLTPYEQRSLIMAKRNLEMQTKERYFEILSNFPLLGYLKSENPNNRELERGFSKMEQNLQSFLKKIRQPSVNMGLLLSFEPLVEELLKENGNYCPIAERSRLAANKSARIKNYVFVGAGFLSALPCFMTGPVGAGACLLGGLATSGWGWREAASIRQDSFGQVLTGKEFETMAELDRKSRDEFLAKIFLPLAAWGTTAVPVKAASNRIKTAIKNIKSGDKNPQNPLSQKYQNTLAKQKSRLLSSYSSVLKRKSPQEQNIIMQAIIGMEGQGMSRHTILKKIRLAVGRCSLK